jgi:hypothetical protein
MVEESEMGGGGLGVGGLGFEDAESMTMMSDETQESPVDRDAEVEDEHLHASLPWIKVSICHIISPLGPKTSGHLGQIFL